MHKEIAIKAAQNGKMILCEKPLATNLKDAQEMLDVVEKANIKHMIDFNYRKVPAICFAKKLIEEGYVGDIYHFRGVFLQDWIVDPNFPLVWRLQQQESGSGAHGDLNAHVIDLARFLVGDIEKVIGMNQTFIKERPLVKEVPHLTTGLSAVAEEKLGKVTVDDATLFLAKFKNGALGTFEATRFATGNRCGLRFEINGSKGSIRFKFDDMNFLEIFSREDPETKQGFKKISVTEASHPYMASWWPAGHGIGYEHTFVHIVYDFMEAIANNTLPSPNFYDGVECQKVLDAVEKSIREERWVKV
jgi:predicted dehydrogenase